MLGRLPKSTPVLLKYYTIERAASRINARRP
jgi:hypothetical protein